MTRSRTLNFAWRLAVCVAGAAVLVGCSDTKPREAGRDLVEKVEVSQRRYNKALSLLEAPVFKHIPTGDISPLKSERKLTEADVASDLPEPRIHVFPLSTVNPGVFDVLEKARKELSGALKAGKDADASARSLAESMLGRIDSLLGRCHAQVAHNHRMSAHSGLDKLERLHFVLSEQVAQARRYKDVLDQEKTTNDQLARDLKEVVKKADGYASEFAGHDGKIGELRKKHEELVTANNALAKKARDLRARARDPLTTTAKALEFDRARLQNVEETNSNAGEIARIENEIESLSRKRAGVKLLLTAARRHLDGMEKLLKARRKILHGDPDAPGKAKSKIEKEQPPVAERREKLLATITGTQEEIRATVAAVVTAAGKADEEGKLAKDAFDRATGALANAVRLERLEKPRRPETLSAQGDQHMAMAEMTVRRLHLHRRATRLAEHVEKAWKETGTPLPLPADLDKFRKFVSEPDETRKDAMETYNHAADLYGKAVEAAPRRLDWTYWFSKADAHIGIYQLSNDPIAQQEAIKAIREAQGYDPDNPDRKPTRASSPYIKTHAAERLARLGAE